MVEQVEPLLYHNSKIADFIPVVCHYDASTLLTKDGDLMHTILFQGLGTASAELSLRDLIRKIIDDHRNPKIAIYVHSLNVFEDITQHVTYKSEFLQAIDKKWSDYNQWSDQLITKIYVTFVFQGYRRSPFNIKNFHNILFPYFYKKEHFKALEANYSILNQITESVIRATADYEPKLLGIKKGSDNKYYSEISSFFYYLIHLKKKDIELDHHNICEKISDLKIEYKFNSLEILSLSDPDDTTKCIVFSLKGIQDLSISDCVLILEHDYQYVITESIMLVPTDSATKDSKRLMDLLEAGNAQSLYEVSGIKTILQTDVQDEKSSYCQRQINICLYHKDEEQLNQSVHKILELFANLGITPVREDFFMPICFWSRIPGNFSLIKRNTYNITKSSATFAFIPNYNNGGYKGSKWGLPITLLKTSKGAPYYFNFHDQDLEYGNTLIIGPNGSGKSALAKFLLAQTMKVNPRIIMLSRESDKNVFIQKIGGVLSKMTLDHNNNSIKINLFDVKNYNGDVELMRAKLASLILGTIIGNTYTNHLSLLDNLIALALSGTAKSDEIVNELNELLKKLPESQYNTAKFLLDTLIKINAFQDGIESINNQQIINIEFTELDSDNLINIRSLMVEILFNRVEALLTGAPTVIFIGGLLSDLFRQSTPDALKAIINRLNSKNAIVILSVDYIDIRKNHGADMEQMLTIIATKMFLPDRDADKGFRKLFKISENDLYYVKSYNRSRPIMLISQSNHSRQLSFDIGDLKKIMVD